MSNKPAVLITGVGQRVGLHLTHTLLEQGYHVIGTYRTKRESIDSLQELGVELYQTDFYNSESLDALVSEILARHSSLRALIHNASEWLPDKDFSAGVWEKMFQIHVHVPYTLNFALSPLLEACGEEFADIIHFSDYAASTGSAKHSAYAASKAALDNLTLSFAARLAPKVKVNSIAPGLILFNQHDTDQYKQRALQKSLIPREGGLEEISDTVNYLLNSRFITGRVIPVDGGRHIAKKATLREVTENDKGVVEMPIERRLEA